MITKFELFGLGDPLADRFWFIADFQKESLGHPSQHLICVDREAFVAHRAMWENWGWNELMKFIAYNIVDRWDTQDTYARYSLVSERPCEE